MPSPPTSPIATGLALVGDGLALGVVNFMAWLFLGTLISRRALSPRDQPMQRRINPIFRSFNRPLILMGVGRKTRAGFSIYALHEDVGPLSRAINDPELTKEILSL